MRKKGIAIWLLTTLTFIALIHLIDAAAALLFNSPTHILQLYPIINQQLQQIPIDIYLYASAAATIALWAITCLIAVDNPVEEFLNKILSDAKTQTTTEAQIIESKSEILDLMYETIEKTRSEVGNLKKQMRIFEEKLLFTIVCPSCGKLLRPDFKLCPYCGESIALQEKMMVVKDYK